MKKRKNKKSQVQTEVFIYILTLVIVGMIVVFGYKAIAGIRQDAERAEIVNIERDLANTIKTMKSSYGSIKTKEFVLPGELKTFCAVDLAKGSQTITIGTITSTPPVYGLVTDAWGDGTANLFLLADTGQFEPFMAEDLVVTGESSTENYLCISSKTGKIRIKLEGKGDYTVLSKAE